MKQAKQRTRRLNLRMVFNVLVLVALVAVVIVLVVMNNRNEINDDSFVSNDSKIVVTMDKDIASYDDSEYEPPITHVVYQLAGDNVDNVKLYFEYDNEDDAKEAYENISMEDKTWAAGKALNGKYVIFDFKKEQYEGLTSEQVKKYSE